MSDTSSLNLFAAKLPNNLLNDPIVEDAISDLGGALKVDIKRSPLNENLLRVGEFFFNFDQKPGNSVQCIIRTRLKEENQLREIQIMSAEEFMRVMPLLLDNDFIIRNMTPIPTPTL